MLTIKRRVHKCVIVAGLAAVFSGCSGQQQSEEDLAISEEDEQASQQNLGEDDAAEGNGQENFVENDEASNNQAQANNQQGADVNNETGDDTQAVENGAEDATLDSTGGNPAPVANPIPMNNAAMAAPVDSAPAAAAPTGGAGAPVAGGRVRYVKSTGLQVMSAPNGSPVRTLEQGDHPVTWEENGWLRIADGMYVPVDSMSDAGVARSNGPRAWGQ